MDTTWCALCIQNLSSCDRYMACKGSTKHSASKQEWSHEDLDKALSLVREENVSIRTAALSYGIPKSTLHDHCSGKVKGSKCGRQLFYQMLRN